MLRKLMSWNGTNPGFRKVRAHRPRGKRRSPLRDTILGVEQLESRVVLNSAPVLSIEAGQFFGEEVMPAPFRATFTDVSESDMQTFDYTIDWGDDSPVEPGNTTRFATELGPFGLLEPPPVGNPINGMIETFHSYADPGQYTVTVTLTDGLGGMDTATTQVNVYPVDSGLLFFGDNENNQAYEGSPYSIELSLIYDPPGTLDHWTVNWGDSIQEFQGAPSTISHTYADDETLNLTPGIHAITVLATRSDGIYFGTGGMVEVFDLPATASVSGASEVDEGATYTLNLSASDPGPGDPVIGWIIAWGDEVAPDSFDDFTVISGNPPSATHVYADGDASYNVIAIALFDQETLDFTNTPSLAPIAVTVHNADPIADAGGPYQAVGGDPIILQGSATDPGINDLLTFTWDLDGDAIFGETGVDAERGDEVGANPVFDPTGITGNYTVTLRVEDDDGGVGEDTAQIVTDGVFLVDGTLSVIDSDAANETVTISQSNGNISVTIDGTTTVFSASDVDEINVSLGSGSDIVIIGSNILVPVTVDGGAGNDLLIGGGGRSVLLGGEGNDILWGGPGDDVLLGGAGNDDLFGGGGNDALVGGGGIDILSGGSGRDLLIGSQDEDLLAGGNSEDILIGGSTVHDDNVAALDNIMAIWGSSDSFNARVATLTASDGLLEAGVAVFDDDSLDVILGGAGGDLVFGDTSPVGDGVVDLILFSFLQDVLISLN